MNDTPSVPPATDLTAPAEAALLGFLLATAWDDIRTDPDVSPFKRLDAFKARVPDIIEAAQACRMALRIVDPQSEPEAVAAKAAANAAAAAAEDQRFKSRGADMAKAMEQRAAAATVEEARGGLARVEAALARLEGTGADDGDVGRAEAAVAGWRERVKRAEAALAALEGGAP